MQPHDDAAQDVTAPGADEANAPARGDAVPDLSALRPLDPRVVKAWRTGWLVTAGLFALAAAALLLLRRAPMAAAAGVVALAWLAAAAFLPRARYRAWGFQLRAAGLLVRRGVLWRSVSVVPHARIQYVDTRRGPLERALGLATVVVYTAGSRGAAVRIPGLDAGDAEALRDRLAALGDADDAV